jgi:filamentous hemagglutinin family protein
VAACFIAAPVFSNPVNPTVVNGTASFSQAGNVLTVTNSNGAIINWDKFSIKVGEITHFAQTAASSTVMNRVLNDPTVIYGTLSSNGRVFLVNPAGILVGPGGRVDTAGFVASTLNIRNEDFLAGRNLFINDGGAKDVINQGEIRTPAGGSVYLIGTNVGNEGIITTPQGETILAAGATVSLIDSATPGVKVDITGAEGNATNLGTITAEAGRIGIAGVIVRNSGTLNASSVVSEGGRIFLKASQDAYVDGNGRIVTTGTKGGSVEVLGDRVAVMDKAEIDASGANGGGRIMVGGDYQGKNPDIQNASVSYFGPNASLKADATGVGDGGTVIVWADDTTRAYGSISAKGGAFGGGGGLVETSGHRFLSVTGAKVDTRAPNGKTGNWLLDPTDITIVAGSGTSTGLDAFGVPVAASATIYAADINANLASSNAILYTSSVYGGMGNITITSGVIISGSNSLTLAAYGGAGATGNISITGSNVNVGGDLKALAGWNGATTYYGSDVIAGTGNINISASRITSSGNIDLHAGNDITLGHTNSAPGTWIQSGGTMSVSAGNDLRLLGGSGSIWHITDPQGPGVMLQSTGTQTITAVNQILLQAGSFDNTQYGGNMSAGSVGIWSDADQTVSANVIKLYAGASGHDNAAGIHGYGSQVINITGTGGLLELRGGGDSAPAVYGGAGSYNNQARIEHGQWYANNSYYGSGAQTITIYGGGSVNLQAGSGTGARGYYSSDCYAMLGEACRGSSNDAAVYNGVGAQTLDFVEGGFLSIYGGSAGTQNWAGINNQFTATTQTISGNASITVTGGSGGGSALSYGGNTFQLSNDAGINSQGSGDQSVNASSITLSAGNALYGGAGIGSERGNAITIVTTGDLSMYGGSSSAGDPFASGVYIGSKDSVTVDLNIGGNLYIESGSGTSSPALIGSLGGNASVAIITAGDVMIDSRNSGVGIGSISSALAAGSERGVFIGGNSSIRSDGSNGILIKAGGSVGLSGNLTATMGGVAVYGGGYGGPAPDGGDIVQYGGSTISGANGVLLVAEAGTNNGANGNITQHYGGSIDGGEGGVGIIGSGTVRLDGSVTSGSDIVIAAGTSYYETVNYRSSSFGSGYSGYSSQYGGNVIIGDGLHNGSGRISASSGSVSISANVGYGNYSSNGNGNITQKVLSSILGASGVDLAAAGSVELSGTVTSSMGTVSVRAGYQTGYFADSYYGSYSPTPDGGNIVQYGGEISGASGVNLIAYAGYAAGANGNITQNAGSILSDSDVGIYADGNVALHGRVETPNPLYIYAGLDNASSSGNPYNTGQYGGNIVLGASSEIYGGHVELVANRGSNGGYDATGEGATGNITQAAGGQLQITGITSLYGYAAGNVDLLGSTVIYSGAPIYIYAGYDYPSEWTQAFADKHIRINSLDASGSSVNLYATGPIFANTKDVGSIYANISNSSSGGIEISNNGTAQPSFVNLSDGATANSAVSFRHSGSDLTLNGSFGFSTYGGAGSILVGAPSNNLTLDGGEGGLSGSDIILAAGNDLSVASYWNLNAGSNLGLFAGNTLYVNNYVAGNNIGLIAPTINISAGVSAGGNSAAPSTIKNPATGVSISFSGVGFIAGDLVADGPSAYLRANDPTGDVSGLVARDITLTNGAYFQAGNDVDLTLAGATSMLSLSTGGYVLANSSDTIHIAFTSRSSGGVMIDGVETTKPSSSGSGFFVSSLDNPVTDKPSLDIEYSMVNNVVDPCVTNPTLCKVKDKPPTQIDLPPPPPPPKGDDVSKNTGGTEGTFGADDSGGDKGNGKDEKKDDEKDKKDKKSDEAKDEKKDEKPAQKKVANCQP